MDKKTNNFVFPLLIVSIVINLFMFIKISNMDSKLQNLNYNINNIESHVDNSINNISHSVSEALKREASVINDFQFEYGEFENGYVDLKLSVKPKTISDINKYYFSYSFGNNKSNTVTAISDDNKYYANIKVPIKENIEVDFIIDDGSSKFVESLNYIYNYEEKLLNPFNLECSSNGMSFSHSNNMLNLHNVSYNLTYHNYEYKEDVSKKKILEDVKIYVSVNDKIIDSFPMEKAEDYFPEILDAYNYKFDKYSIKLNPNDKLEIYALVQHEDGYKVKIDLDQFSLDEKGEPARFMDHKYDKSIVY